MPTLTDFQDTSGDLPILTTEISNTPQVEPLGGPITVDDLMDRFPLEVYDQGTDTHIYRFLTALCGDAGSGLLKKQSYAARLITEAQGLTFGELDAFYTQNFRFERLKSELYPTNPVTGAPYDPTSEIMTPQVWDNLEKSDNSYHQRFQEFMNATRLGNSPEGIKLAAKSATGIDVDTVENYKAIFDALSDDVQGIVPQGTTYSPDEFILTPRVLDAEGNQDVTVSYQADLGKELNPTSQGVINESWVSTTETYLNPDIERNMIRIMDRLRPVSSLMTVTNTNIHYKPIPIHTINESSHHIRVTRFVTGNTNVTWPPLNPTKGHFITSGVETQAPNQARTIVDQPTIFLTVESIFAYLEEALDDPTYDTADFFAGSPSPFAKYRSEHTNNFYKTISQIFTFLQLAPTNITYDSKHALAANAMRPILIGKADNNGGS